MKTLVDVKEEIMSFQFEQKTLDKKLDKAKLARIKNQIEILKVIERYIESNPDAEYIRGSLQKLEKRQAVIMEGEALFRHNNNITDSYNPENKKLIKKYYDDCGLPTLKKQIKALKYILN